MRLTRHLDAFAADLAIAPSGGRPDLDSQHLYRWELRAYGRDISGTEPISLTDVARRRILITPTGHRSRNVAEAAAKRHGLTLDVHLELADHGVMRELARRTDWWAILPSDAFGRHRGSDDGGHPITAPPATGRHARRTTTLATLGDTFHIFRRAVPDRLRGTAFEQKIDYAVAFIKNRLGESDE